MDKLIIHKGSQGLHGYLTDYSGSEPVRAVIHRDAYDTQSNGIAQVWSSRGWVEIQRFPIERFAICEFSYVSKDGTWERTMEADLVSLVEYATIHMNHATKEAI